MSPIRYLALGDSYTIGTGASEESRNFPSWLARRLEEEGGVRVALQNPAVNGYTSRDLIDRELPQVIRKPDVCTILIGANDVVQGLSTDLYRHNVGRIYDFARGFALPAGRVGALSIPDFSVMPAAVSFGAPPALSHRIDAFNAAAREQAERRGFPWIDLTDLSRSGAGRPGWAADDQLHPADAQYRAWADWIWPRLRSGWITAAS